MSRAVPPQGSTASESAEHPSSNSPSAPADTAAAAAQVGAPASAPSLQNPVPPSPTEATGATTPQALDPASLLEALWPSTELVHQVGYLKRPGGFRNAPVANAAEALVQAIAASERGEDSYFALAEYANADSRKADNVVGALAFWLDIDCGEQKAAAGKGYKTNEEAREAVDKFCRDTGLPKLTHLADSGGGLHVYWALTERVDIDVWQAHAQKLKALSKSLGLLADPSRTADIASVLRIPGTLNHKYTPPKPVTLIVASPALIETGDMLASIDAAHAQFCAAPATITLPATPRSQTTTQAGTAPINLSALRSALGSLDPDCDDQEWKLHRMAPLAAAAREHPDQADELKEMARDFSSGTLRGQPSVKWSTPGASNGLTGEQVFEQQWQRFFHQPFHGTPVTVATIFHDAIQGGWTDPTDGFSAVEGDGALDATGDAAGQLECAESGGIADQSMRLTPTSFPDQPAEAKGPLPATLPNLRHLLKRYGIVVRYNVIKKKISITIPKHQGSIDNADNVALTKIISLAIRNGFGVGQVPAYVDAIADENLYNPAADWIMSRPWDGVDRLPAMYATLQTREGFPQTLKVALMYRWLLSLVAAALKASGFKGRGVLTLQGPQGIGKTSWVISLVDDPVLRDMLVKVDHHLDPSLKDSILGAMSHWIVEIGELDSSFRKDMARLKGVLTSDADKIRRPYARTESEYQRRTVFMATVNEATFLVDHTGNSRWWTLPVVKVNFNHGIDVQQVFAQLAVDFHAGKQWWLTADEDAQLAERNERHRSLSAVEETLMAKLDLDPPEGSEKVKMTALKVLKAAGIEKPSNPQCKDANAFLRRYVGEPKRTKGMNYWSVVLREDDSDSDDDPDPDAPMEPFTGA